MSLTSGNNDVDLLDLLWDLGVQSHGVLLLFEAQQTTWGGGKKEKRRVLTLTCTLALMSCAPVLSRLASGCSQHTLQEANPNLARLTGISTNLSVARQVSFGAPFVSSCDASWFSHQAPSCSRLLHGRQGFRPKRDYRIIQPCQRRSLLLSPLSAEGIQA